MALDSIGSDLNKIGMKPITQIGEVSNASPLKSAIPASVTPSIEKDGANVNANKGKIPASGSIFGGENKSSGAEKIIQQYSSDKKQLQSFLSALENVDLSDGISNESDEVMNELLTLGFDMKVENGKIVITDTDGNEIKPEDFNALKTNLKNTLKRSISSLDAQQSSAPDVSVTNNKPVTNAPQSMMSEAQQNEMLNVLQGYSNTEKQIESSKPLKAELEKSIKEYEAKMSQAENQSKKIDMSISQILSLRTQAEALVEKSKTQPLTTTEKKQLASISSTIDLKQKEMQSYQQGNELLMQQVDQVFSQFSDNLSESEKSTKSSMQAALKAKVSGQGLTVRENFLASISEDIYKLTANMSPDELEKTMSDPAARVKLLAPTNKLIDKMSTAKSLKDFSAAELDTLWTKFKIKGVEENGQLNFYYHANDKTKPEKVSNSDFKQMRVDINNVVTSPDLFTLARAAGQISIAYDTSIASQSQELSSDNNQTLQPEQNKFKQSEAKLEDIKGKARNADQPIKFADETSQAKEAKRLEITSIDKSMQHKKEEEKYHEKQIKNIYENRREINKFIDAKRAAQVEQERDIKDKNIKIK